MEYIVETSRNLVKGTEHLRAPSPIFEHSQTIGHTIKLDNFSTVDREPQDITRTIQKAIYIRVNDPL